MKGEYVTDIYFEVSDKDGFMGGLLAKGAETTRPYCSETYLVGLLIAETILKNANLHLFGVKEHIPREVFALRLLERQSLKGNVKVCVPDKTAKTKEMLKKFKKDYNMDGFTVEDRFHLTLDKDEARELYNSCELSIFIDLSKGIVIYYNFLASFKLETYCKLKEYDPANVHNLWKTLKSTPKGILNTHFNDLEDMYIEISENAFGFKGNVAFPTINLLK